MRRLFILLIGFVFASTVISAQNNENKADDAARISITPQVSDQEIPANAQKMLINKMRQICTKNGLSGSSDNPLFVMDASIDILSKDITPTAPPMHALSMQINFYIKGADGNVYSETSYTTKGVGKNETKAYIAGIKNINTSRGQFKAMVDKGKQKIIEYYNSNCDFVISKATALHKNGSDNEAIKVLNGVPSVCKECYDMSMELLSEIEPQEELVVVATKDTTATVQTNTSTQTSTAQSLSSGASATAISSVGISDIATIAKFPDAKTTYTKTLKYSAFYLPVDKLGNFTFGDDQVSVNGMITRYQFEVPGDNNPDYLLKLTQPVLQALGFQIIVAKNNDQLTSNWYRNYKNNGKLGGRYQIPWDNNCSYLFAKGKQDGKDVYISIFFMEFNDLTVITQDYAIAE